ncbi:MAG: protein-L-isoaspartate O-methyltransferase family protein [Gammaproteobacteria bacterium]
MTQQQMIDGQLRTWEVLDARVLAVYRDINREDFAANDSLRRFAFDEAQLPLGGGRFMLEPKLEARMLQALMPGREEKILHIGTGSGFFAAMLGLMAGEVITMEIDEKLAKDAAGRLAGFGARNVDVRCADGVGGLPDEAPFDAIVLTASSPILPPALWHQIKNGGRLLCVIGDAPAMTLRLLRKHGNDVRRTFDLLETCIEPLVNAPQPPRFKF